MLDLLKSDIACIVLNKSFSEPLIIQTYYPLHFSYLYFLVYFRMKTDIDNPWDVGNLDEFLYFCCPECDLKDRSKTHFLQHALTEHPKSKECVQQFNDFIIKEEPNEGDIEEENENEKYNSESFEDSYYPGEEYSEMLKCEIKEEPSEPSIDDKEVKKDSVIPRKSPKTNSKYSKLNKNFPCDFCEQKFARKWDLRVHHLRMHKSIELPAQISYEKSFKCEFCSKTYGKECYLETHTKKIHGIVEKHKCEFCNKVFDKKSRWAFHVKLVHEKGKSVVCDVCGKPFSHTGALRKHHQIIHEGIKNYPCKFCNKSFIDSSDLRRHIKCVHEGAREHICDLCGQAFSMSWTLKGHIKTVHEGIKDNACKICDKLFANPSRLKEHFQTVHEGIKKHKCLICEKRFAKPSKLKNHLKSVHPGVNIELSQGLVE